MQPKAHSAQSYSRVSVCTMTMDITNKKDTKCEFKSDHIQIKNEALLLKPQQQGFYKSENMLLNMNKDKNDYQTEIPAPKTIKRSFDVAFLMLPDEKLKQKRARSPKMKTPEPELERDEPEVNTEQDEDNSDEDIEVGTDDSPKHKPKYLLTKQIFDDPKLKSHEDLRLKSLSSDTQRSAFTKFSLSKETRNSPALSVSPDLSYQNSLSPSPPRSYQFSNNVALLNNPNFKANHAISHYQSAFMQEQFAGGDPAFLTQKSSELMQPNLNKIRPMYRPDLNPYSYAQFPTQQDVLKMSQPDFKFAQDIRNPAAAILSSLLPPSLAALSLPAQNVCAKCNITFRMTSDLVYHMRSHHKNDATDYARKRREDKLKCPVCSESFRERHHLTRHMTAHQDKDNDDADVSAKKKAFVHYAK